MKQKIAVIGGCNIDMSATAYTPLILQDSNPGILNITLGGVGRNIAENLSRLGFEVYLISALGQDHLLELLRENAKEVGMDISHCMVIPGEKTSTYVCINHPNGDIAVAVSAMDICDKLTPTFLEGKIELINSCDYVIMDTNIPQPSIDFLFDHCTTRLCADTVSSKKAKRLFNALKGLYFLKANRGEAEILADHPIQDQASVQYAANALHAKGIQNVAITLSESGAFLSNGKESVVLPPYYGETVNSTGCGDAYFAGALLALSAGCDVTNINRCGLAMASLAAGAESAVSPTVSVPALWNVIELYQGGQEDET